MLRFVWLLQYSPTFRPQAIINFHNLLRLAIICWNCPETPDNESCNKWSQSSRCPTGNGESGTENPRLNRTCKQSEVNALIFRLFNWNNTVKYVSSYWGSLKSTNFSCREYWTIHVCLWCFVGEFVGCACARVCVHACICVCSTFRYVLGYTVCQTILGINTLTGITLFVHKRCALPSECSMEMIGCHNTNKPGIQVSRRDPWNPELLYNTVSL